jgi:hypothetical protein
VLTPYICVACEKVIIDQSAEPQLNIAPASGPASLINLFSRIIVQVPEGAEIPRNAVGPHQWAVFSAWNVEEGDEKKEYYLFTSLFYPDGEQFGAVAKARIPIALGQRSQLIVRINGFPIGQKGFHTVKSWIEEDGKMVCGPIEFKIELQIKFTSQAQQP